MKEVDVLLNSFEKTREYTHWYLDKLVKSDADLFEPIKVNGVTFNPVGWELGHIVTSENFLGLYLTNGKALRLDWAPLFGIGASLPEKEAYPSINEMLSSMEDVHTAVKAHFKAMRDDQLNENSRKEFAGITDVRGALIHMNRHEGIHTGHLSWHCKYNGIKTV